MEHKKVIEAALFISSKPLDLSDLAKISGLSSLGYLKDVLKELQKEYEGRGIEIVDTKQGWEMQVRTELLPRVSHLTPHSDLPEGCKRTLALIVYKEPVQQSVIIKMQGNKAYNYIKELAKRGLIKAEKKGHSKILSVTSEFERYFGEEKERVKEKISQDMAEFEKQLEKDRNEQEADAQKQ